MKRVYLHSGWRPFGIEKNLRDKGFAEIRHVSGRKKGDLEFHVPGNTDVVLVLTNFVCHGLARKIKVVAHKAQFKTIFARCSWVHIDGALSLIPELEATGRGRS